MAQMTVPTLATWCAVYTIADQASEPYLSYVLHEDEELIDGIKSLLSKIAPPDPVPTPGARVWSAPGELAHQAALRTSMRDLGLNSGTTPQLNTGIGPTLATAAAVGGETVVLPLVARNRVIGMLTLGKPTDEHFRQEILELAEDLSRRAALALDNARLYSERTAISQSLQRSLLPRSCPSSTASRSRSSTARPARATRSAVTSTTSSRSATTRTASPSATSAARDPTRRPSRAWPGTPCACWPARA